MSSVRNIAVPFSSLALPYTRDDVGEDDENVNYLIKEREEKEGSP